MDVLLCGDIDAEEWERWRLALVAAMPEARWLSPAEARQRAHEVLAAVVANPPPGSLQGLPKLALVQSLWAGVDRLLADRTLPLDVPIARMVDPVMNRAMAETALWATLSLHRGYFDYARRQREGRWVQHDQRRADEVPVLVLGHGQMGQAVAATLAAQGYPVVAWRHTSAVADTPAGARVVSGTEALRTELARADVVINLLPLTDSTRDLLDAGFFAAMRRGAAVVNLARGAHLVDADLLAALDAGQVGHAVLDVFRAEPLPADHAFWTHDQVTLLPHAAALTDARSAAEVAVANLRALQAGRPLKHLVDRRRGY